MKQASFGQSLPDHLREPQRFSTCDQWRDIPLTTNDREPLPTIGEALIWLGSFAALVATLFVALGQ